MNFATTAVHAGNEPEPSTGAIMTPIFQTSTYVQAAPGQHKGYEYSRTLNPTRHALETALAALEGAKYGLAFASGMAAADTIIRQLKPGDEVVAGNDLYGGVYRLFARYWANYGIHFKFVAFANADELKPHLSDATRMVWVETPTNPMLSIVDLASVAALCQEKGIISVVDNTFASPALQQPLCYGIDIVTHSCTKYLGGHSDVVLGAVMTSHEEWYNNLKFMQNAAGAVPGPMDSFLVLRGIKTLHLRMEAHGKNAAQLAEFLLAHPAIENVYYPGLPLHPGHAVAARQMKNFGGMITFTPKDASKQAAERILSRLKLFSLAESLGGVESLVGLPAEMTHASVPAETRKLLGITDATLRLSVGIEDVADLQEDLRYALS